MQVLLLVLIVEGLTAVLGCCWGSYHQPGRVHTRLSVLASPAQGNVPNGVEDLVKSLLDSQ